MGAEPPAPSAAQQPPALDRGAEGGEGAPSGEEEVVAKIEEEDAEEAEEVLSPEAREELSRLKANAVAAWLVNISLVAWIVWLYRRSASQQAPPADDKQAIITLLSRELADENAALSSDRKLREDLQQEAAALASIARRVEAANAPGAPLLAQLQSLLATRDAELQQDLEETSRDLREITTLPEAGEVAPQRLVDDSLIGPLTSSASWVLAGIDVTIAAQTISLALLFSVATNRWREGQGRDGSLAPAAATDEEKRKRLRSQCVLRFYGRWDGEQEWVLLQSVALKGTANSVVGTVRNARGWMGGWSDRLITALVARSARGMVRRRGWKRIVEQTMDEVGRTFTLGYLVETAADKVSPRIEVDSAEKAVLEVPSAIVLEP